MILILENIIVVKITSGLLNTNLCNYGVTINPVHYWLIAICKTYKLKTVRKNFEYYITSLPWFIITDIWYGSIKFSIDDHSTKLLQWNYGKSTFSCANFCPFSKSILPFWYRFYWKYQCTYYEIHKMLIWKIALVKYAWSKYIVDCLVSLNSLVHNWKFPISLKKIEAVCSTLLLLLYPPPWPHSVFMIGWWKSIPKKRL